MDSKKLLQAGLITLIACLFFGVTIIAIAGGALYPPLNRIAKPFVCANGAFDYTQAVYHPSPGTTITTTTWTCTDAARRQTRVIPPLAFALPAGIIYGVIAFFPSMTLVFYFLFYRPNHLPVDKAAQARQGITVPYGQGLAGQHDGEAAELAHRMLNRSEISPAAESGSRMGGQVQHAAEELGQLKQLLNSGLITQQDYDQKKAEILARL